MVQTYSYRIRVTSSQRERIHANAHMKGYKTIATYLRDLALQDNSTIELKIAEILILLRQMQEVLYEQRRK